MSESEITLNNGSIVILERIPDGLASITFGGSVNLNQTRNLAIQGSIMRIITLLFLICSLIGCASTHMQQYVGKDIREVILDSGPPINAMDMGNGVRAFQFRWGGGTFSIPQTTTTTGMVTSYGNSAWLNASSITSGGGTFISEGCVITYMVTWSESAQTWVVSSYRIPKQLVC